MRDTRIQWAAAALVSVAALLACNDELIGDPSFDRWCGEMLCNWELDAGSIEQVASWHTRDYAVAFADTPTQISQLSDNEPASCVRFEMIVDAEARAKLSLQLDFNDDGTIDVERPIPGVRWKRLAFHIFAPVSYDNVRFILRKDAEGRAVVGQLRARRSEDCSGPRVELRSPPGEPACREHDECSASGEPCVEDGECASGRCCDETCAAGADASCD